MTAPSNALLRTENLGVYRGSVEVLRDISIEVVPGEILAVLGPNGAGKSTLLATLGGLLRPSSGTLHRNGRVATALQSPDLARRTCRANVELALGWWGVPRPERASRAAAALSAMQADHLADRQAGELSGGERRRVHLARAVAIQPDVLLLDEPFAGLDPATRGALLDDTSSAIRASAGAVILVVHDRAEAWALADRLAVVIDGQIAAAGSPRAILDAPPSPAVARFLGFTGELRDGNQVLMTRPSHVVLDAAGDLVGTVQRLVPLEDGTRVELRLATGALSVVTPYPGPSVGEELRVRVVGGVRFDAADVVNSPGPT